MPRGQKDVCFELPLQSDVCSSLYMPRRSNKIRSPKYLPKPNVKAVNWLSAKLRELRGTMQRSQVAEMAKVESSTIEDLEQGKLCISAGELRDVVHHGYGVSLLHLLSECYEIHKGEFDVLSREFWRRNFYRIRLNPRQADEVTPLFTGGDPSNYMWAIPFRGLGEMQAATQHLFPEFLEFAPLRKRKELGYTRSACHDGEEMLFVIRGAIEVFIQDVGGVFSALPLESGESVVFKSMQRHYISNSEKDTSALVLVVRHLVHP